ncbi:MAG: type II CAAX endopeptidase family protein [Phycisphaerae bacterium]|nr:type II CAAX endopeptidase family protein [Phycisphaerae bacterium]
MTMHGETTQTEFPGVRHCPPGVALVAIFLAPLIVWLFTHSVAAQRETIAVARATGGLVLQTLQLALAVTAIVVGWLAVFGRMRWRDLGFRYGDIGAALLYSLVGWAVISGAAAFSGVIAGGGVRIDAAWVEAPRQVVGRLIAQIAGNALCEELIWRGFLVPQVHFLLARIGSSRSRLFVAAIIAAVLFALYHIPMDASKGTTGSAHAVLFAVRFLSGLLLTAVWLLSGNLLIAVACHSLINEPSPLFAGGQTDALRAIVALGTLAWYWGWSYGGRYARNT